MCVREYEPRVKIENYICKRAKKVQATVCLFFDSNYVIMHENVNFNKNVHIIHNWD